jgi:ribosomal-protein-alanine N-acetyltransferase
MIFEPATSDDAAALARVHAQAFSAPWSPSEIAALSSGPNAILFAARKFGAIAGFILCRTIADEAEVLTLATAPEHRRHGVGRHLLEIGARTAEARGATRFFLEVAADNIAAIALYERAGFHRVGARAGYYSRPGGGVDALVMRRDLNR